MPYAIRKVAGGWSVVNSANGRVHSKHTSKSEAHAQLRLLQGIHHGFKPTGKKRRK